MKKPFIPQSLPLTNLDWPNLINLIADANTALAHYDGRLESIPNPEILLSPLITNEAVLSSKIEGTITTLEEVLEFEVNPSLHKNRGSDIAEVLNYRTALKQAEEELTRRPFSLNTIKNAHYTLMAGVRGANKMRGQFRKTQNWIGKPNTPMAEATYIPPAPDRLTKDLSNWEKYCHHDEKDRLIQLAIVHAQFEIIHPFLDGNGRIGRILIPLFLFEKKKLNRPMFYISSYFEATRDEYYARLLAISEQQDWTSWITYFLTAIIEQASKNTDQAKRIMSLYEAMKTRIPELTHSQYSIQILDFLFHRPIFTSSIFTATSGVPKPSVARIMRSLEGKVITVVQPASGRSPAVYWFPELLKIVHS